MKKYIILFLALAIFAGGFYASYRIFSVKETPTEVTITSQSIIEALKDEGFLISESYIFHQQSTIEETVGNTIKDFFWGQNIKAAANIKVSVGTNLERLLESDVEITKDTLTLTLPPVSIYGVELIDDVVLENKQGVLKKVFDNDNGYNKAIEILKGDAKKAVEESPTLLGEAKESAKDEVTKLLRYLQIEKDIIVNI
ncbi:MAG: DUF4230 domain-containing protein [Candidatus Magasanikbacteria bacterium]|nr:DUF4230 domain-containing protein [Candidatus Magasanikbacteria bacterium]MBT4221093.1 DUF4230 domain-containing protein [Candidatus Magasanikbacteria bacterium]MBT4350563.1 DUF4230 domain-containing protein [Candidatus Magasanikbacteria bacterium]MBT4542138.1 DUF4230 domain-containing protein [Candidatus Magasanikbacteria bacterium]MBT6253260.1 DUF4230 domain-containing protein [Candidatus Magasanikbacteria bacterium]